MLPPCLRTHKNIKIFILEDLRFYLTYQDTTAAICICIYVSIVHVVDNYCIAKSNTVLNSHIYLTIRVCLPTVCEIQREVDYFLSYIRPLYWHLEDLKHTYIETISSFQIVDVYNVLLYQLRGVLFPRYRVHVWRRTRLQLLISWVHWLERLFLLSYK